MTFFLVSGGTVHVQVVFITDSIALPSPISVIYTVGTWIAVSYHASIPGKKKGKQREVEAADFGKIDCCRPFRTRHMHKTQIDSTTTSKTYSALIGGCPKAVSYDMLSEQLRLPDETETYLGNK